MMYYNTFCNVVVEEYGDMYYFSLVGWVWGVGGGGGAKCVGSC